MPPEIRNRGLTPSGLEGTLLPTCCQQDCVVGGTVGGDVERRDVGGDVGESEGGDVG